jgi:hypothetical protein
LHRGRVVCEGPPADIVARTSMRSLEEVFISIARDGEIIDASPVVATP